MKQIIRIFILSFILAGIINCEDKPDKSFYGIPEEDKNQILAGLILSNGVRDTATGSIIDPRAGLEWKKCSEGQVFRSANNDCQGTRSSATLTTPGDQGRYGANLFSYCNIEGNNCNAISIPMTLKADSLPGISSEAYNVCAADRTNGYTNWRVPSYPELKALSSLGKVFLTASFPNTPDEYYWTSWGNEQDQTGSTARAISFSLETIGKEQNISKTTKFYVRCVRNTNGL